MNFLQFLIALSEIISLQAASHFLTPIEELNPVIENLLVEFGDRYTLYIIDNDGPIKTSQFISAYHVPVLVGNATIIKSRRNFQKNLDYESRSSLISFGTTQQFYDDIFPRILDNNPKQKFLAILSDFKRERIEEILEDGNERFKLSRLYIADSKDFMKNSSKIDVFTRHILAANRPEIKKFSFNRTYATDLKTFEQKRFLQWNQNAMKIFFFRAYLRARINKKFEPDSIGLVDGEILKIFAQKFNFTIKLVFSPDNESYGYRLPNGTFTGSLGMIEYERADMAGNGKIVIDYETNNMLMLPPIQMTHFIFVFPKKQWSEMNMINSYFNFIDSRIYLIMFVLILILPLIVFIIEIAGTAKRRKLNFLIKIYLNFIAILSFVSTKFPLKWPSRWIVVSFVLVSFVLGNVFAAKITNFLFGSSVLKDIETLEELLASDFSIKIPTSLKMLFEENGRNNSDLPESHRLIQKIIKQDKIENNDVHPENILSGLEFIKSILRKRIAILTSAEFTQFLSAVGNDQVAYTKSSYSYFSSMAIRQTLPMLTAMGQLQLEINAAGIPQYQSNLAKIMHIEGRRIRLIMEGSYELKENSGEITLKQISTIFIIWGNLLAFSALIFVIEVIFGKCKRKNLKRRHKK